VPKGAEVIAGFEGRIGHAQNPLAVAPEHGDPRQPATALGAVGWNELLGGAFVQAYMWSPGGCLRFNMSGELVQDSLPTLALDFRFVFGLRLKSLPYKDSVGDVGELNLNVPTVS
jgi:hypothetical protein